MKFGLMFTNTGMGSTPAGARQLALAAEGAGFESLWTVEHVVVPSGYESKYPTTRAARWLAERKSSTCPTP